MPACGGRRLYEIYLYSPHFSGFAVPAQVAARAGGLVRRRCTPAERSRTCYGISGLPAACLLLISATVFSIAGSWLAVDGWIAV